MLFRWQGPLERLRGRAPGAPTLLKPEHSAFFSAIISFMLPGEVYLNKAFCALKSKFENHCCLNLQIRKTVLSEGHAPSQKHLSPIAPTSPPPNTSLPRSVAHRFASVPFLGAFQVLFYFVWG